MPCPFSRKNPALCAPARLDSLDAAGKHAARLSLGRGLSNRRENVGARALGHGIFTEAETWEELRANVFEAISVHFEDSPVHPRLAYDTGVDSRFQR